MILSSIMKYCFSLLCILMLGCNTGPKISELCPDISFSDDQVSGFFSDLEDALNCAEKTNKPILVVFTKWARSNSTFEDKILIDKSVQYELSRNIILLVLMADDELLGEEVTKFQLSLCNEEIQPVYSIINHKKELLIPCWGYSNDPKVFLQQFKKLAKLNEFE